MSTMLQILLYTAVAFAAVSALAALAYLAACAGANRWLTFREWWGEA